MKAPERALLVDLFRAGLDAVDARAAVRRFVCLRDGELSIAGRPVPSEAQVITIAVGKAAAAMARAVEEIAGSRIERGVVITKDDHGLPMARLALRETAHPVPDARSENAGREALRIAASAKASDVLLVLLSGGASALMACPPAGVPASDLADASRALLGGGVDIAEFNCVRKHVSAVSGGRLALAAGCRRIEVLAISDVPGDRLEVIGSGPCAPDPTSFLEALAIVERANVVRGVPATVRGWLSRGSRGELAETPAPGDPSLAGVRSHIIARNADAVAAAAQFGRGRGLRPVILEAGLRGEAHRMGSQLAALARSLDTRNPVCVIAGGETTVTLRGTGRGGRNQELALAAAIGLEGAGPGALLAAGTDGTDGPTSAAGAFVDGGTVERGRAAGVDARACLADNDSHSFFAAEGGLFETGPTGTNVMDLSFLVLRASRT